MTVRICLYPLEAYFCSQAEALRVECGGEGYNGLTDCSVGYYCEYVNPYYSQCKRWPSLALVVLQPH